jgi:hypothetical protein
MKIYFINSKKLNCGVYQYGFRVWNCLKNSDLNIHYFEIENKQEFLNLDFSDVNLICVNYIYAENGPFYWYDNEIISYIKNVLKIKTLAIRHTNMDLSAFDYVVDQNPDTGFPRPLYSYDISKNKPKNNVLNIGSFGFANIYKGFDDIVNLVNSQLDSAKINLHITNAHYGDANGSIQQNIIQQLKQINLKPGIELNITTNFISNEELLDFTFNNDIVLFGYRFGDFPSSVPDYPISTNTPIGITNVGMFQHLYNENLDIHKKSIKDILQFNIENKYVETLREKWSQENFIKKFKLALTKINL